MQRIFRRVRHAAAALVLLSAAGSAAALDLDLASTNPAGPVALKADKLEYDRSGSIAVASGNVVARRGEDEVRCDRAKVNMETGQIHAEGNVMFRRPGAEWTGETFDYNFHTREWQSSSFDAAVPPFHVWAGRSEKTGVEYILHNVDLTTCALPRGETHYRVRARRASIIPGQRVKAYGATVFAGAVPVFYVPYWYRSLSDRSSGFAIQAGYANRMGAYLLTSYKYGINPNLRAVTQLDVRSKRGAAVGQEFKWKEDGAYEGRLHLYYADDQGVDDDDHYVPENRPDPERYRVRLQHRQELSPADYLLADLSYLSDDYLLEDFFRREYRDRYEPDNFLSLTHQGVDYTAGILARMRLNDFYTVVERLPELWAEFPRQQIEDTPLFYEGRNGIAWLRKSWEDASDNEDYDSLRIDSAHTLFWPTRHFGYLNVIPRGGYRATYYSDTLNRITETEFVTSVSTNWVAMPGGGSNLVASTTAGTNAVTRNVSAGSGLRSVFELGLETSFRAFRVWDDVRTDRLDKLRHVVEPYANYTYIPEPNLTPDELYQFDRVDRIERTHTMRLGARNQLQTRRRGRSFSLIDLDVYTTWNIEKNEGEGNLGDLVADAQVRLWDRLPIDFDLTYSMEESELTRFNAQLWLRDAGPWRADLEYHYRLDRNSLISADISLTPVPDWTFGSYTRYEAEDSQLEEQTGYLRREFDCLVLRLGAGVLPGRDRGDGTSVPDDYRMMVEVWIKAFPDLRIGNWDRN